MSDPKDQTRLISKNGFEVANSLKIDANALAHDLLKLQIEALEEGNVKLAEQIAQIMQHPQRMAEKLDAWTSGDIKRLFARIKAMNK